MPTTSVPTWLREEIFTMPYHRIIELVEFLELPDHAAQIDQVIGESLAFDEATAGDEEFQPWPEIPESIWEDLGL